MFHVKQRQFVRTALRNTPPFRLSSFHRTLFISSSARSLFCSFLPPTPLFFALSFQLLPFCSFLPLAPFFLFPSTCALSSGTLPSCPPPFFDSLPPHRTLNLRLLLPTCAFLALLWHGLLRFSFLALSPVFCRLAFLVSVPEVVFDVSRETIARIGQINCTSCFFSCLWTKNPLPLRGCPS